MTKTLLIATISLATAIAGCAATPVAVTTAKTELGFRRIVESGLVTVSGTVRVPAALMQGQASLLDIQADGGPARLNEVPLEGAEITVVDALGAPVPGVGPVKTGVGGRFALRGLQPGQIYYVQAAAQSDTGVRRVFQAFLKPTAASACVGINLASTLVALRLQAEKPEDLATDQLEAVIATARDRLPALLDQQNGHAPDLGGELADLLDDLTGAPGAGARDAAGKLLDREPALKQAVQEATSATLEVNFTIQATGLNSAPLLKPERLSNAMSGKIEFVCRIDGDHYERVAFWLDNERIAEAARSPSGWVAQLDTTTRPDGAYVLTVVAESGGAEPMQFKTFIYLNNTQPKGVPSCGDAM